LYSRYAGVVYTLCLRLLANARAAEEATVSVFVQLSREVERLWDSSYISARLRDLSILEAISRLKVLGNKALPVDQPVLTASRNSDSARLPLDRATLDALVARLPDTLRITFVLRDREGLSNQAIANYLRVDDAEGRRLVSTARLELRRLWLQLT
jgi:DNA-directed RNA polymerase specialized sigma24 family protein